MEPSKDWAEKIDAGEAEAIERAAEALLARQKERAKAGTVLRGLHAKPHAGVLAELVVASELPAHARAGIFARPGAYRVYARFSNGGENVAPDVKPDVRGVAIKILGVPGRKLIPGMEDATTQDFLLVRSPHMPFHRVEDFAWLVQAARKPALLPARALGRFGLVRGVKLLAGFAKEMGKPMRSLGTTTYYSALPTRFGDYAAKYSLVPHAPDDGPKKPPSLRDELAARLRGGDVVFDLRAQFFVDEERTPIEDPTRGWDEADAPWTTVAQLTIPRQDLESAKAQAVAAFVEKLSFDPWHAPVEFRPLGHFMRARNVAYRISTQARGAAPEPDGSETF